MTIYWKTPVVLSVAEQPVTPDTIVENLKYSLSDSVVLAPSIVGEMSRDDEYIETLKKLAFVTTGGGK